MKQLYNRKGFTLIELLVVIAIIGILSTIAIVALGNARAKSRDAKRVADVKQMMSALELFYNDQDRYPTVGTAAGQFQTGNSLISNSTTYMALVPSNPQPLDYSAICTGANSNYTYVGPTGGNNSTYTIKFCLGAQTGDLVSGTHTAIPGGIQ